MMLRPGATIGILGGGQLARMLAIAAARLGFRVHIFCPEPESPALAVSAEGTVGAYEDEVALARFAAAVDVITYEFENVPVASVAYLETLRPVHPGARALAVTQDRLAEKRLARSLGAGTADFAAIDTRDDLDRAIAGAPGLPAVLKTTRLGYDGKGQAKIRSEADAEAGFAMLRGSPGILEAFIPFEREVSVIATRFADGRVVAFDVTENEHRNHILDRSFVPAQLPENIAAQAISIAGSIGEALGYIGTFAVEFFVVPEAGTFQVLVNEIAPRVHNSGHWTIDGAVTCQFEQHIRAIIGWPPGDPSRRGPVEMINLVGADAERWQELAAEPRTKIHLYGKTETREGRKMGHATRLL